MEGRPDRGCPELHRADRRRRVEVLELAPEAGEPDPGGPLLRDAQPRGRCSVRSGPSAARRRGGGGLPAGRTRSPEPECMRGRTRGSRARSSSRATRGRRRPSGALPPAACPPRSRVSPEQCWLYPTASGAALREDDVHDLPVAFVRLPDKARREERVAVEIVVVEEPVLQDDQVVLADDARVDGRLAPAPAGGDVAREVAERRAGEAVALVQPPDRRALGGQVVALGAGSTTTQVVGLVAASRLESSINACTVPGRNSSPGWKTKTGRNRSRTPAREPAAWAVAERVRAASTAARTTDIRRSLIGAPFVANVTLRRFRGPIQPSSGTCSCSRFDVAESLHGRAGAVTGRSTVVSDPTSRRRR